MKPLRIIVGGMVGQFPLGGVAWDYFHYCLGLAQLGHHVTYYEDTWVWPYDPKLGYPTDNPEYTVNFIGEFFRRYMPGDGGAGGAGGAGGVREGARGGGWYYRLLHDKSFGMSDAEFREIARSADIFLNVSGACFFPEELNPRCVKVWMDTDPGYNQIRLATKPAWAENIDRWIAQVRSHDRHLTYAENIYGPDCLLPRLDFNWIPTRPIATLPEWRAVKDTPIPDGAPYTTVMSWDYFPGKLELNGVEYHGKPPEYERFRTLPLALPGMGLALAVGGHKTPKEQIVRDGWGLIDARAATLTPESYQDFIARSAGEWSIAKNVFVHMRTGWFSCRTACYLAAARPAVVQETGWSKFVPAGAGVHAFTTLDEAKSALEQVHAHPKREREAAYAIAHDHLSPQAVLPKMLTDILTPPSPR